MKAYCGDYWKDVSKKRFPWTRIAMIALILGLTTAATPAMVAYYWNGQNSEQTLALEEAWRIVQDDRLSVSRRRSAAGKVFTTAQKSVQILKEASRAETKLARDSHNYLKAIADILSK